VIDLPILYVQYLPIDYFSGDVGDMEIVDEALKMAKYKENFEHKDTHTYPVSSLTHYRITVLRIVMLS